MTTLKQIAHEIQLAEKIISAHGIESQCMLYQLLAIKALQTGVEEPYKWASNMSDLLHKEAIKAL